MSELDGRPGSRRWWTTKVRQARGHLRASVRPAERAALGAWLSPAELALFDAMPPTDRRHGLDVLGALRAGGAGDDRELLVAGLLHDCGKGPTVGLWPRVAWSLGEAWGPWVVRLARLVPGSANALERLRDHAALSADAVLGAGASRRTAELIRHQAAPTEATAGELLRLADEAS